VTRCKRSVGEMEQVVPSAALLEKLRPYDYSKPGQVLGRPPMR
jgi:hypothetical protein